jgi:hypothetical protein
VVFIANDRGSCFFDEKEPDFDRIITITHFGLHRSPGGEVGRTTMILPRASGCFNPEKDVVAPGNKDMLGQVAAGTYLNKQGQERFEQERTVTLVFAGAGASCGSGALEGLRTAALGHAAQRVTGHAAQQCSSSTSLHQAAWGLQVPSAMAQASTAAAQAPAYHR